MTTERIKQLEAALAALTAQEPVGLFWHNGSGRWKQDTPECRIKGFTQPLYAQPKPARATNDLQRDVGLLLASAIQAVDICMRDYDSTDAINALTAAIHTVGMGGVDSFCLGYTHKKCDTCQHEKNWQALNRMPDVLRHNLQHSMVSVDTDKCRLTQMGEYHPINPPEV